MFYNTLGGEGFRLAAETVYQAHCDLSRLLDLGRAILVASRRRQAAANSSIAIREAPLAASDDPSTVVYRVVFPVSPAAQSSSPEPLNPARPPMLELRDLTKKYGELFANLRRSI